MSAEMKPVYFSRFIVTSAVFHTTPHSMAFVNIKPLVAGHVLVSPHRIVPRLSDLRPEEISDLYLTVNKIGKTIERVYGATALNIAMQDGVDAGQSVPHVHVHILPRKAGDLDHRGGGDALYGLLEGPEGDIGVHLSEEMLRRKRPTFPVPDEAGRKPRSEDEMRTEAQMLKHEMEKDSRL